MSASQLGILLSAFFWSYTAMQFVSGWLVDRFNVNLVIAAGYLLWTLATATTGIVRGFTILLAMRLMLGIGESVAFPSCSKILARHVPQYHRGFANGVIASAFSWGNEVGTFGGDGKVCGFANFAYVVAPALTGLVVDRTNSVAAPLAITAVVLMGGGLAWIFVAGRVEQLSWVSKGENLTATATGTA